MGAIGESDYRNGARERLEEAFALLRQERCVLGDYPPMRGSMASTRASTRLSKQQLERILAERLALETPRFLLEKAGGRWVGNIVSPKFSGMRDHERQSLIWDALESALGPDAVRLVGMLLAYTPDEWELDEPGTTAAKKNKRAG